MTLSKKLTAAIPVLALAASAFAYAPAAQAATTPTTATITGITSAQDQPVYTSPDDDYVTVADSLVFGKKGTRTTATVQTLVDGKVAATLKSATYAGGSAVRPALARLVEAGGSKHTYELKIISSKGATLATSKSVSYTATRFPAKTAPPLTVGSTPNVSQTIEAGSQATFMFGYSAGPGSYAGTISDVAPRGWVVSGQFGSTTFTPTKGSDSATVYVPAGTAPGVYTVGVIGKFAAPYATGSVTPGTITDTVTVPAHPTIGITDIQVGPPSGVQVDVWGTIPAGITPNLTVTAYVNGVAFAAKLPVTSYLGTDTFGIDIPNAPGSGTQFVYTVTLFDAWGNVLATSPPYVPPVSQFQQWDTVSGHAMFTALDADTAAGNSAYVTYGVNSPQYLAAASKVASDAKADIGYPPPSVPTGALPADWKAYMGELEAYTAVPLYARNWMNARQTFLNEVQECGYTI